MPAADGGTTFSGGRRPKASRGRNRDGERMAVPRALWGFGRGGARGGVSARPWRQNRRPATNPASLENMGNRRACGSAVDRGENELASLSFAKCRAQRYNATARIVVARAIACRTRKRRTIFRQAPFPTRRSRPAQARPAQAGATKPGQWRPGQQRPGQTRLG
jgi:hypothetical protein